MSLSRARLLLRSRFGWLTAACLLLAAPPAALATVAELPAAALAAAPLPPPGPAPAFDANAATDAYLARLPAEARAKSDAYFEGGYWLPWWELAITLTFTWLLLRLGFAQRLRDWSLTLKTTRRLLAATVFILTWVVIMVALQAATRRLPEGFGPVRLLASLGLALYVTFALLKAKISYWSRQPVPFRACAAFWFVALFVTVSWVVTLPWSLYTDFFREHAYGLSNLTLGAWLGEQVKSLFVEVLLAGVVGALLVLALRRFQQRWWIVAGLATPVLLTVALVLSPVFIAPLFNTYTPLDDARVRDPILSLARANSVPVEHVYQFDASKQTTRISANVSGAFSTLRVSLNDNLLHRCTPAEIQAVMAHELGHYVLNHVYKLVIYLSLLFVAALAFAHGATTWALRRWGERWELEGIDDLATLPLLVAALGAFLVFAAPLQNTIIRTTEAEADLFGLNAARQPDGFATTALKLSEYRKLAPGPIEEFLFFDHPSGRARILMAMRWKAENLPSPPSP